MLVDLPKGWEQGSPDYRHVGFEPPRRIVQGVYLAHLNFGNEIGPVLADQYPTLVLPNGQGAADWFSFYGVVDHWQQLPLDVLRNDSRPLLVYLTEHVKADQPARFGWRWHKWGPYLGVHDIEGYEYLYDTPTVERVYSYHVVELRSQDTE